MTYAAGTSVSVEKSKAALDALLRAHFASTWDQIYGDGASWKSNPWVWRIGFKRIEVP